jgi:hypothetical protein
VKPELFGDSARGLVWLNGRAAVGWEIPVIERARRGCSCPGQCPQPEEQLCARAPDLQQLAGVLSGDQRRVPDRPPKGRKLTVSDLDMEWLT